MAQVVNELYPQACQNNIENVQELKQWIYRWPYLNFNDHQFLERHVWLSFVDIEIFYIYNVN